MYVNKLMTFYLDLSTFKIRDMIDVYLYTNWSSNTTAVVLKTYLRYYSEEKKITEEV